MPFWCEILENTQKSRDKCIPLGLKLVKISKNRAISLLIYGLKLAKISKNWEINVKFFLVLKFVKIAENRAKSSYLFAI